MDKKSLGPYFDRRGNSMSLMDWSEKFRDMDYKVIRRTDLPDGKLVSTVWLGMDHNFGSGAPLIFETMVFPSQGDFGELDMDRYATEAEAITGHEAMVARWTPQQDQYEWDDIEEDWKNDAAGG